MPRPSPHFLCSVLVVPLLCACGESPSTPANVAGDLNAVENVASEAPSFADAGALSTNPTPGTRLDANGNAEPAARAEVPDAGTTPAPNDAAVLDEREPPPSLVVSGEGAFWQVSEPSVTEPGSGADILVLSEQELQTWQGFGGTFNEAGWSALLELDDAERRRAIRLLFDAQQGAHFRYGRLPIGSSDYGLIRYSLAETPDDFAMQDFSIERDRALLLPYVRAALSVRPDLRLWASPWSPPPWMKDNGAFDRGNMLEDPQVLQAHALYLARFVEEYAGEGIRIEAVHPQNEPGYPQDYPSCSWTPELMAEYIGGYLGPTFDNRGLSTEIWLGTMSNPNSTAIVDAVMTDSIAASYVRGIGLQWNMVDSSGTYAADYQLPVMQTEHRAGNYPWVAGTDQTRAPNDYAYAIESWGLIREWIEAGVHSYLAWNMVLDTEGRSLDVVRPWAQNALLAVDRPTRTLVVTPTYYVFRHLSQFVEPGAVRLATEGGDALAFRNPDGSIVSVVHNAAAEPASLRLGVAEDTLEFEVPAQGWATVNWQ